MKKIFILYVVAMSFVCCSGRGQTKSPAAAPNNSTTQNDSLKQSVEQQLLSQIGSWISWSKTNETEQIQIDTLPDKDDNVFLSFREDGSLLLKEVRRMSEANYRTCKSFAGHLYDEEFSVCSFKPKEYISFLYTMVDIGIRREYIERCITMVAWNGKVYEIRLVATPGIKEMIRKAVSKYDESRLEILEYDKEYGLCIMDGNICVRPIPYLAFDDDGGDWVKIPLSSELKFKLVESSNIIKELSEHALE